jgi:hypothetical protein
VACLSFQKVSRSRLVFDVRSWRERTAYWTEHHEPMNAPIEDRGICYTTGRGR